MYILQIDHASRYFLCAYVHTYVHMRCACYNTYMYKNTILLNTLYVFKNGFCIFLPVRLTSTDSYAALCSILGLRRRQKRRRPKKPVPPQLPPLKKLPKKTARSTPSTGEKKEKKNLFPCLPPSGTCKTVRTCAKARPHAVCSVMS